MKARDYYHRVGKAKRQQRAAQRKVVAQQLQLQTTLSSSISPEPDIVLPAPHTPPPARLVVATAPSQQDLTDMNAAKHAAQRLEHKVEELAKAVQVWLGKYGGVGHWRDLYTTQQKGRINLHDYNEHILEGLELTGDVYALFREHLLPMKGRPTCGVVLDIYEQSMHVRGVLHEGLGLLKDF